MGYAWAPQITGLIRGEPKPGQRHRSNGKAILMECMEERASKSPTLDRKKSIYNTYWHDDENDVSGTATWDDMCEDAEAYRVPVKLRNGQMAERGLPHNAVIGWGMIIKPSPDMIAALDMSDEDVVKCCFDAFDAMCKIEPKLFRYDNLRAFTSHRDEDVTHLHCAGASKDKAGKYCGNLVDANLCIRICEEFPALMREKGWPVDDLDMTDWERMGDKWETDENGKKIRKMLDEDGKPIPVDPEYRAERTAKRKRQGQTVTNYAKQKASDARQTATGIITDAQKDAQAVRSSAEEYSRKVRRNADKVAERVEVQEEAIQAAEETLSGLQASISALQEQKAAAEDELQELEEDKEAAADSLKRYRESSVREAAAREKKCEELFQEAMEKGVAVFNTSPRQRAKQYLKEREELERDSDREQDDPLDHGGR